MIAALLVSAALTATDINKLDWLIGEWEFRDYALPAAGFKYEETGRRFCEWALDRRYIRCQSTGRNGGKERTYVFYMNANGETGRFEMLSMFGNTPGKSLKAGSISPDGRTLDLVADETYTDEATGKRVRGWSVIRYDGNGASVWDSGNAPDGEPDNRTLRFRDEVKRAKE